MRTEWLILWLVNNIFYLLTHSWHPSDMKAWHHMTWHRSFSTPRLAPGFGDQGYFSAVTWIRFLFRSTSSLNDVIYRCIFCWKRPKPYISPYCDTDADCAQNAVTLFHTLSFSILSCHWFYSGIKPKDSVGEQHFSPVHAAAVFPDWSRSGNLGHESCRTHKIW